MLKDRQVDTDNKLDTMQKENEALWQDVTDFSYLHTQFSAIMSIRWYPSPPFFACNIFRMTKKIKRKNRRQSLKTNKMFSLKSISFWS